MRGMQRFAYNFFFFQLNLELIYFFCITGNNT